MRTIRLLSVIASMLCMVSLGACNNPATVNGQIFPWADCFAYEFEFVILNADGENILPTSEGTSCDVSIYYNNHIYEIGDGGTGGSTGERPLELSTTGAANEMFLFGVFYLNSDGTKRFLVNYNKHQWEVMIDHEYVNARYKITGLTIDDNAPVKYLDTDAYVLQM